METVGPSAGNLRCGGLEVFPDLHCGVLEILKYVSKIYVRKEINRREISDRLRSSQGS